MKSIGIIVAASALIACGGGNGRPQSFEPGERATATAPEGYTAAEYLLATAQGDIGDVKVWSRGAQVMRVQGIEATVVQVSFEVDNSSQEPIELTELSLDSATFNEHVKSGIAPARIDGSTTIEPGRVSQISAYFPLPPGISPREVDAFRVRWRLYGPGISYTQHTPFTESTDEQLVYYYTPYYDPFYYDWYFHHPRVVVHRFPYRHLHTYR